MVGLSKRRKAARHLISVHGIGERRECWLIGVARSVFRYVAKRVPQQDWLISKIKDIALSRVRYGIQPNTRTASK